MTHAILPERVASLRAWAEQRIATCRRTEAGTSLHRATRDAAATERVVLMQVLDRLGYPVPPRESP